MPSEFPQVCGGKGFVAADSYSDRNIPCIERYGRPCPECPKPSESLPAKLRELADKLEKHWPTAYPTDVLRAAAERIEEQEVRARAMYPLPAELAAMKAERDAAIKHLCCSGAVLGHHTDTCRISSLKAELARTRTALRVRRAAARAEAGEGR